MKTLDGCWIWRPRGRKKNNDVGPFQNERMVWLSTISIVVVNWTRVFEQRLLWGYRWEEWLGGHSLRSDNTSAECCWFTRKHLSEVKIYVVVRGTITRYGGLVIIVVLSMELSLRPEIRYWNHETRNSTQLQRRNLLCNECKSKWDRFAGIIINKRKVSAGLLQGRHRQMHAC